MRVCPNCGEENPDRARVCMICATPLAEAAPRHEERKGVTVLFADLVGFTSRSEAMDVEDVRGTLQPYHQLLRRELERHGGTVEKFIGDAVMALFGAPVAHEDDPERAVRAALAIQDAVARLRQDDPRLDLHVRIGVNTGEALVALGANPRAGEGMASGDVVNTAARLQSAAPVDGVLVGEVTYRATDRAIRYEQAEPVEAKGKSEPVRVWQAVAPRSLLPEQARLEGLPLVGRATEVGLLVGAFDRSRSDPSTQLVTVVGAPGIGKTRLVEELSAHVEELPGLIRWRRGRSLAYGEGVAFWALGEIIKAEAGVLESDSAENAEAKLRQAVAAVVRDERDRDWIAGHLRPLIGLEQQSGGSGESGRVEAFAAWRRFFEALADDRPSVLVFEDVHWADDALLDFIDLLSDRAGSVPLLVVCSARPELLERRAAWSGGKVNALTINLTPLTNDDTARLMAALLEQALLPAQTQQALLARAEGNPLYAQEYVRMLRDQRLLVREAGGWRLVGEPQALPESVQGIIAARLDTLSPEEKRFVQDASVIGKTAWIGAVCAMSGTSQYEAEELLYQLERKQLLSRSRRSSVAGEVEFSFAHALTHEVAYRQIKRSERAQRHEAAADWIEQLAAGRDDKAELLAHHYQTAYELHRELGQDPDAVGSRAQVALTEAGRQAASVHAHESAARHFAAALTLMAPDDPGRRALQLDHATALWRAGQADELTLIAARDAQVAATDWQAAAWAEYLLADWAEKRGGRPPDEHAAQAAAYARRAPLTARSAEAASFRAYRLLVQGRYDETINFIREAIHEADPGGGLTEVRGVLLGWLGLARLGLGDVDGIQDMEEAATTLGARNDPKTALAYGNLGEAIRSLGDLDRADQLYAQGAAWADKFADADVAAYIENARALLAYHAGRWREAAGTAEGHAGSGDLFNAVEARGVRGRIASGRGLSQQARADVSMIIEYGTATANSEFLLGGLSLGAAVAEAVAGVEDVDGACTRFIAEWQRSGGMLNRVETLAEVAPILAALGRQEELRAAAASLRTPSRWTDAIHAIADDDPLQAARIFAEIGSLPHEARARLDAAKQLVAEGRRSEGEAQAEQSLQFWRSVGATAYVAQCEALLARAESA